MSVQLSYVALYVFLDTAGFDQRLFVSGWAKIRSNFFCFGFWFSSDIWW